MKSLRLLTLALAVMSAVGFSWSLTNESAVEERVSMASNSQDEKTGLAFQMAELEKQRAEKDQAYLSFLNRDSLSCGVYFLPKGGKDNQQPHKLDEVYYVKSGKGKLHVDGEDFDASPGDVLFVAAHAKHYFHSIEEDLTLLVFFSNAE